MAITLVQSNIAGADVAAASKSVSLTQPAAGNKLPVIGGQWTANAGSPDVTAPSGVSEIVTNTVAGNLGVTFWEKTAAGSSETTYTVTPSTTDPLCIWAGNISGAGALTAYGSANSGATSQDGITVTANAPVAANGSLAIAAFVRRGQLNGGNTSYTISSGWTEINKAADGASPANEAEMYVFSKTVNVADGTISCTISGVPSNSQYAAIILVYPPSNNAPVVTNPGTQIGVKGVARTIAVTVADADSNLATLRVQCTSGKGTVSCTLGGASVSAGSLGSADFTLSGTHAQLVAAALTITYTATLTTGSDTAVIVTASDGSLSDAETFTVLLAKALVTASNQTDLVTTVASMLVSSASEGAITINLTATDSGGRTGTAQTVLTFTTNLGTIFLRPWRTRRRRRT